MSAFAALMLAAAIASDAPMSSLTAQAAATPIAAPINESACTPPNVNCRHIGSFGLVVSPSQSVTIKLDKDMNYLTPEALLLTVGESVTLSLQPVDGQTRLALVSSAKAADLPLSGLIAAALGQPADPAKIPPLPGGGVLRLSLIQAAGRPDLFLIVENGFANAITYQAALVSTGDVGIPTQVCPVDAGAVRLETWPDAAPFIQLSGFNPSPAGAACPPPASPATPPSPAAPGK